ncbi:hypothetical protein [Geodermatophilus sp. SYSU D00710]
MILHPHSSPADRAIVDGTSPQTSPGVTAPADEHGREEFVDGVRGWLRAMIEHYDSGHWAAVWDWPEQAEQLVTGPLTAWQPTFKRKHDRLWAELARIRGQRDEADAALQQVRRLAGQWDDMARDHDEQGATTTAVVYRAHAQPLRRALDG